MAHGRFRASNIAKWFHSAPHKDFQLEDTTTIFSPSDESYREALYVLAIFITSFGALLFLLSIFYYTCCFCVCKRRQRNRFSSESYHFKKSCLQHSIFILTLICCGALVVGFIFNGKTSDGVDKFRNSVDEIQHNIVVAATWGEESITTMDIIKAELRSLMYQPIAKEVYNVCLNITSDFYFVNALLPQHVVNESSHFADKVHQYDNYRWMVTVAVLSWCFFACIFLLWTGCLVNGCLLLVVTFTCLLTFLFTWAVVAADFAIATGVADFCVNPKQAIEKIEKGHATEVVISFYMNCPVSEFDPFGPGLNDIRSGLERALILTRHIPGYPFIKRDVLYNLHRLQNSLSLYEAYFDCDKIHPEYMDAMNGLCVNTLNSLAVVILAVFVIAFFSGLLMCCVCPLWQYRRYRPTTFSDIKSSDDIGNAVLWWPHDIDYDSSPSSSHRRDNPNRTERSPLLPDRPMPNYETGNRSNVNFIHVDYRHMPREPESRSRENRHSF